MIKKVLIFMSAINFSPSFLKLYKCLRQFLNYMKAYKIYIYFTNWRVNILENSLYIKKLLCASLIVGIL